MSYPEGFRVVVESLMRPVRQGAKQRKKGQSALALCLIRSSNAKRPSLGVDLLGRHVDQRALDVILQEP